MLRKEVYARRTYLSLNYGRFLVKVVMLAVRIML
jgi:hypothetical protein